MVLADRTVVRRLLVRNPWAGRIRKISGRLTLYSNIRLSPGPRRPGPFSPSRYRPTKNRRSTAPFGASLRRLTRQRASRHSQAALHQVFRSEGEMECQAGGARTRHPPCARQYCTTVAHSKGIPGIIIAIGSYSHPVSHTVLFLNAGPATQERKNTGIRHAPHPESCGHRANTFRRGRTPLPTRLSISVQRGADPDNLRRNGRRSRATQDLCNASQVDVNVRPSPCPHTQGTPTQAIHASQAASTENSGPA